MLSKAKIQKMLVVLLLLVAIVISQEMYTLNLHPLDRGAVCLDGSPAGLYFHQGSGANKNKYLIYLNSGGLCIGTTLQQTLQDCYQRSFGSLGSTKNIPQKRSFDGNGLLSTLQTENPLFFDWTKIYVIYCDGSEYTGYRKDPISFKDRKLYFRGYNNMMQQFYYLNNKFDFYNGDTIVLTGVSAGGMGTYFYNTYLYEHTKKAKVYAIPDSGLFITDYYSPIVGESVIRKIVEPLVKLITQEGQGFPYLECFQQFKGNEIQCYNTANLAKYYKAPLFIIQSPYDEFSEVVIVNATCLTNHKPPYNIQTCNDSVRSIIQNYRMMTIDALNKIKGTRKDVGVWAPSCVQHGFTDMSSFNDPKYKVPSTSGLMVYEAINQFLNNSNEAKWYLDQVPWPWNNGCNGINPNQLRTE